MIVGFRLFVWFLCGNAAGVVHRGLYTNYVEDAHETYPLQVTETGEHLTDRRDENKSDRRYYNVTIEGVDHFLKLQPNTDLISPGLIVERRKKGLHVRSRPKSPSCHFHGSIYGQDKSTVSLSTCEGLLTGIINSELGEYYIEPSVGGASRKHLVYKRAAFRKKRKRKRRKSLSQHQPEKNCATREPKKMTLLEWQKRESGAKIRVQERKHKQKRLDASRIDIPSVELSEMKKHKYKKVVKRSFSKPQYVEALIVADSTMVEFHESGDIETYLLTIMNMVSSLYLDPSIGNSIRVVVVKIILIDDPLSEPDLNVTANADATLRNFCKWQHSSNPRNESHPHHHDVAILVTRRDICSRQNSLCNTLGVAHIGGMCRRERSCSVNEDNGISLAHTIAHEMGHNFGMYHDTEKIGCQGLDGKIGHIMAPSFLADTVEISWSRCSCRDITKFLDKGLGACLQDEPTDIIEYEYPELPAGAMYNGNHQCRLQFGEDAQVCTYVDDICARLWCSVNGTCSSQLRPAAPGTKCGKHKWCQNLKCVPIVEPPLPIDGGWGEWSSWSECSRTCGAGVSLTERKCDHPRPAYGGRFCIGERKKYRICNTEACPKNRPTFRAAQCSAYDNSTFTWVAHFDEGNPCDLYCSDLNETVVVPWGESAADGTPCNLGTRDVCIAGICRQVGCDWVVGSNATEDKCGICQGDGTKCNIFTGVYRKQSHAPGYREVVVIPPGARNIRIQEKNATANYISLGSAHSKKFYLNGKRHITLPGEYTVAGAQAMYKREHQLEKIHIPGPITEPVVVYILYGGKTWNPGVEYNYSMWKKESTKQVKYVWVLGLWSQCSATCGGGTQQKKPQCQEKTISSLGTNLDGFSVIVDELNCDDSEKPEELMRACNDDPCPSNWWVGPWQSCPLTCFTQDERPLMRRSVMCVDGQQVALPDHFCDKRAKPLEYTKCKSLPVCVD